jgi:perosamine synthetase
VNAGPIALFGGAPSLEQGAHRLWPEVTEAERQAVLRVLDRGVLSGPNAPEAMAFEQEFARFVGAKYALLTHCGTSALHLALSAFGIGAGDHVIVPAYSFVATPLAVLHAGAIPIFADVDADTGTLNVAGAEAALTSRTRAVMPVHVHGGPADLAPLVRFAEKHRLTLVEDAAQAHGATYAGRPVGALGHAGGFSLQSSKNLAAGEGGIFVTNDERAAEEANRVRNFGQDVTLTERATFDAAHPLDGDRALESLRVGWMYRGNELMAAFARAQLARLPEVTARAQANAQRLSRVLAELPGVLPPVFGSDRSSVHHKFRVRLDPQAAGVDLSPVALRDAMLRALRAEGLEVVLWQTGPLVSQRIFQTRQGFGDGWPWSTDRETDFASQYNPNRFPNTQALLDGSVVLFSQSCPLIAQSSEVVDCYAEAFARVWDQRKELERWARRETPAGSEGGTAPAVSARTPGDMPRRG